MFDVVVIEVCGDVLGGFFVFVLLCVEYFELVVCEEFECLVLFGCSCGFVFEYWYVNMFELND